MLRRSNATPNKSARKEFVLQPKTSVRAIFSVTPKKYAKLEIVYSSSQDASKTATAQRSRGVFGDTVRPRQVAMKKLLLVQGKGCSPVISPMPGSLGVFVCRLARPTATASTAERDVCRSRANVLVTVRKLPTARRDLSALMLTATSPAKAIVSA